MPLRRRFYREFTEELYKGLYIDSFDKKIYIGVFVRLSVEVVCRLFC
jgi:hypothetical protein